MMFLPSLSVSVLANTGAVDDFGDPVDTYQAARTGLKAHIWEESATVFEPSSGRAANVDRLRALVLDSVAIKEGERLEDESSGNIYLVLNIKERHSVLGVRAPQELELERVN